MNELKEIEKFSGIKDFKNLSKEDVIKLTKLQADGILEKTHIEALTKIAPEFIKMQIEVVKSFAKISGDMKESQIKSTEPVIESIQGLTRILETLASKAQSDSTIEKIAELSIKLAEKYTEILEINRKQNKDNNNNWKSLLATVGVVVISAGAWLLRKKI